MDALRRLLAIRGNEVLQSGMHWLPPLVTHILRAYTDHVWRVNSPAAGTFTATTSASSSRGSGGSGGGASAAAGSAAARTSEAGAAVAAASSNRAAGKACAAPPSLAKAAEVAAAARAKEVASGARKGEQIGEAVEAVDKVDDATTELSSPTAVAEEQEESTANNWLIRERMRGLLAAVELLEACALDGDKEGMVIDNALFDALWRVRRN